MADQLSSSSVPLAATMLPLASALGYVAAVLMVKRASVYGVGLWRTAFVSNVAMGLIFSPLWLLGGADATWTMIGVAAGCAALFFAGQVLTFAALAGDVSLATPVLGLKIIFVAGASSVLVAEPVRPSWWIAAALATAGVALLQSPPRGVEPSASGEGGQKAGRTVALAAGAAVVYAVFDVLVQRLTPNWGPGRFLPAVFGLVGLFSFGLIPVFAAPLRTIPRAAWVWLLPGAVLLAMQAAGMAFTLGTHGRATAANILYSTRGLWSVLAVGVLGAWLGTAGERKLAPEVFRRRLWGAGLMMAAVALVLG